MKKNSGMTMVEVLMGFVILMLFMGMLSGLIAVATNIYHNSVDLRNAEEALQEQMYRKDVADRANKQSVSVSLVPAEGMPGEGTVIPMEAALYKLSCRDVLSEADANTLDMDLYFLIKNHE